MRAHGPAHPQVCEEWVARLRPWQMHAGAVCGHDAAAVAAGLERLADLRVQARSRGKAAEAAAARAAAAAQVRPVLIHLLCSGVSICVCCGTSAVKRNAYFL